MNQLLQVSTPEGKDVKSFRIPQAVLLTQEELDEAGIDFEQLPIAEPASSQNSMRALAVLNYAVENLNHQQTYEKVSIPEKNLNNQNTSEARTTSLKIIPTKDELVIERVEPQFMKLGGAEETAISHTSADASATNNIGIFLGALGTLLVTLSLLGMIICAIAMLFFPEEKLLLIGPGAALVFGLFYLLFCQKQRCCVCNQRQFIKPRNYKKSTSHHIKGLGYFIPTCLHIVLRGWYRCMVCGTRLKIYKTPKDK